MLFDTLLECYNGEAADLLQLEAEITTNAIQNPLLWVPTIAFDRVFDESLSRRAETDLRAVICDQIDNEAPVCRRATNEVNIVIIILQIELRYQIPLIFVVANSSPLGLIMP